MSDFPVNQEHRNHSGQLGHGLTNILSKNECGQPFDGCGPSIGSHQAMYVHIVKQLCSCGRCSGFIRPGKLNIATTFPVLHAGAGGHYSDFK